MAPASRSRAWRSASRCRRRRSTPPSWKSRRRSSARNPTSTRPAPMRSSRPPRAQGDAAAVRAHLRPIPAGPRGHPAAHVLRDDGAGPAAGRHHGRRGAGRARPICRCPSSSGAGPGRRPRAGRAGTMIRHLSNPIALGILAILLLILVASTVSIVPETKQAVIVRFGEPQRVINSYQPGEPFGRPAPASPSASRSSSRSTGSTSASSRSRWTTSRSSRPTSSGSRSTPSPASGSSIRCRCTSPRGPRRMSPTSCKPILASALRNELGRRPFAALLSPERGQMMDNIQARAQPRRRANMARRSSTSGSSAPTCPTARRSNSAYRADAHRARAGGALDRGAGLQAGADHPRRRRRRGGRAPMPRRSTATRNSTISTGRCSPTGTASSAAGRRPARGGRASSCRRTTNICGNSGAIAEWRGRVIQIPFSRPI